MVANPAPIAIAKAENNWYLNQIVPTGIELNILPRRTYNGYPGGCGIPRVYEAVISSPPSPPKADNESPYGIVAM
jgi:hypothetical protein